MIHEDTQGGVVFGLIHDSYSSSLPSSLAHLFCIRPSRLVVSVMFLTLYSPPWFSQGYFQSPIPFLLCWGNPLQSFPSLFLRVMSCSATSSFRVLLVITLSSQVVQNAKVNNCLSLLDYFDFTNAFD